MLGVACLLAWAGAPAVLAQVDLGPGQQEEGAIPGLPEAGPPETVPSQPEASQPEERAERELSREALLDEMYQRLRDAQDQQSAELIAKAIEKLWLRSGSDTIDLLMQRALQMVQEENYDVAIKLLDAVVALDPNYAEGWNQRATVHFLQRDYGSSLQDLRHVLSLDPRHFKAINGLALIMQEFGNKPAALKAYRKAIAVHPFLDSAQQAIKELSREVEGQGI